MSDLDTKLREILKHYYLYLKNCELAGDSKISHTAVKGAINDANDLNDKIVAQIKQAMADENYVKVYDTTLAQGVSEGYVVIPEQPMTGQEWYERFKKEIDKLGFKYNVRSINRNMVEKAAQRASGVENEN